MEEGLILFPQTRSMFSKYVLKVRYVLEKHELFYALKRSVSLLSFNQTSSYCRSLFGTRKQKSSHSKKLILRRPTSAFILCCMEIGRERDPRFPASSFRFNAF